MTTLLVLITLTLTTAVTAAASYPTSKAARRWVAPAWWLRQARCIYRHESAGLGWHLAYRDYLGRPSSYSGGLQFLHSTWLAAGGSGHAYEWSPREQQYRMWVIVQRDGGSFRQWGTARMCGLR